MSSLIQIRNVPDGVKRRIKARAAASGQSMNSYLLAMIDRETSRPTVDEVLERAAARTERATSSARAVVAASRRLRNEDLSGERSA